MMNAVLVWIISLGIGFLVFEAEWGDTVTTVLLTSAVWLSFFLGWFDDNARNR